MLNEELSDSTIPHCTFHIRAANRIRRA